MKSSSKVILFGATLALAGATLLGCSSSPSSTVSADCTPAHDDVTTITEGTLAVSVLVTPPYATLDAGGTTLGGVDGEIIKKIAELECLQIKPASVDGAALIKSVQSKRGDVAIGGIYYTDDRAELLDLSDPMYRDGMATLSKKEGLNTIDSLDGLKIGVIQGYLWDEDLTTVFGADNVTQYPDPAGLISDLQNDRIDVGIFTTAEAGYRVSQNKELVATQVQPDDRVAASTQPGRVVLASTKGNTALSDAFNADIATLLKDGSIAQILKDNGMDPELAGAGD